MPDTPLKLPDQKPLLESVGKGIQAFASVEFGIVLCFNSMIESADRVRGSIILDAVRTFETKLKIVDSLASHCLDDTQLEKWRSLKSKIGRRAAFRNKLAHWMVSSTDRQITEIAKDSVRAKAALIPPIWSMQHTDVIFNNGQKTHQRPIYLRQIDCFCDSCQKLFLELADFSTVIQPIKCHGEHLPYSSVLRIDNE